MTCLLTACVMCGLDEHAQCFLQLQGWWDFGDASGEHNRKPVLHSLVMKEIGRWCLAAGDSHSVHHYSSLFIIVYLSFLHIPNIPMSHRHILGASEARRPCQRGSWGIQESSWTSPGGDRSRISQQGGDRSIQKPTEPKVKETDLRSQMITDFQHLQPPLVVGFPFDWTWS